MNRDNIRKWFGAKQPPPENKTARRRDKLVLILDKLKTEARLWEDEPAKFSKIEPVSSWPDNRVNSAWEALGKIHAEIKESTKK